ncbi:hypothetical protein BC830DRAFT_911787 [Chytriomyces sp. MP71]|nr:hypothetical protein BC830DRAFT_911787 [Chytriomyces sp. MP71]
MRVRVGGDEQRSGHSFSALNKPLSQPCSRNLIQYRIEACTTSGCEHCARFSEVARGVTEVTPIGVTPPFDSLSSQNQGEAGEESSGGPSRPWTKLRIHQPRSRFPILVHILLSVFQPGLEAPRYQDSGGTVDERDRLKLAPFLIRTFSIASQINTRVEFLHSASS